MCCNNSDNIGDEQGIAAPQFKQPTTLHLPTFHILRSGINLRVEANATLEQQVRNA